MPVKPLYAIVLAAGRASRFGSTKQLAIYSGRPLVTRAIETAETVCGPRTVLVTGHDWKNVVKASGTMQGFMVHNPKYADGLASSIAMGIRSVSHVAGGALLMLADQPLVTADHLRLLVTASSDSPDSICASAYAGTTGPPVIFPARLFPELVVLQGDRGARDVIDMNREKMITIRLDAAAVDIDRPGDLDKI